VKDIAKIYTQQCIEQGGILLHLGIECKHIGFMGSIKEGPEGVEAEGQGKNDSPHRTGGAVAATDVVIDEE